MPDRDQNWGFGGGRGPGGGPRDGDRRRRDRDRPYEGRSFDEDRRHGGDPWRGEGRYGARYDQDRAYGGQEYGMEAGRGRERDMERDRGDRDERETWRPGNGEPYGDLELNARNRGVEEYGPPHDYAYQPHQGHEFDSDYLRWREEQMRGHDRDYHEWRRNQREAYDDDYRRFLAERRHHFSRSFQDWRSQRSTVGGIADTTVAPGVGSYGDRVGQPSGYDYGAASRPTGMIEGPEALNASRGAGQTAEEDGGRGAGQGGAGAGSGSGSGSGSEFGREPPQVRAAASGWDGRGAPEDKTADKDRDRDRDKDKR